MGEENGRGMKQKIKHKSPVWKKCPFTAQHGKQDRITQTGGTSPSVAENRARHQACSRTWHHPSWSPAQSLFTHTHTNTCLKKNEMFRMQLFVSGRKVMCAACLVVMTQHHNSISPNNPLTGDSWVEAQGELCWQTFPVCCFEGKMTEFLNTKQKAKYSAFPPRLEKQSDTAWVTITRHQISLMKRMIFQGSSPFFQARPTRHTYSTERTQLCI